MTKIIRYWMKTKFWSKVRDTTALFGTGTTIGLEAANVNGFWSIFTGVITLAGAAIGIWMADENNDGLVDLFDDINPKK